MVWGIPYFMLDYFTFLSIEHWKYISSSSFVPQMICYWNFADRRTDLVQLSVIPLYPMILASDNTWQDDIFSSYSWYEDRFFDVHSQHLCIVYHTFSERENCFHAFAWKTSACRLHLAFSMLYPILSCINNFYGMVPEY